MNVEKLKAYVRTAPWRRRRKSAPARSKYSMSGERIIAAIIIRVTEMNTNCTSWRIGLTNDPDKSKAYWNEIERENVDCWTQWEAVSLSDAQNIERYFINEKRMEGVTDEVVSPGKPVFVYIF
jgi:hypothetical protein